MDETTLSRACKAHPKLDDVPSLGFLYPTTCYIYLFKDDDYSELLETISTNKTDGQTFVVKNQDDVSSFKLVGNCNKVKLWDEDECAFDSLDNVVYVSNAPSLPNDLDDVCNIILFANRAQDSSEPCIAQLYAHQDYHTLLATITTEATRVPGETFTCDMDMFWQSVFDQDV